MSLFTPAYTAVSTATIVNGQPNDATPVKSSFDTVNTFTGIIDDQRALSEQTSGPINLVANRDIFVPINCAGGAVTVNLPSGIDHTTQPIVISKIGNDSNIVTIGLQNASNRIDLPWGSLSIPTATSITLRLPGEFVALFPILKGGVYYYRIVNYYLPTNQLAFRAGLSVNTTISTTPAKLAFDTVTGTNRYNRGGFFSTVNNRFVAPFPMVATFHYSLNLSALAADTAGSIRVNGNSVETLGGRHNINTPLDMACSTTLELATNDQVEAWINSSPARQAQAAGTFFSGIIVSRL